MNNQVEKRIEELEKTIAILERNASVLEKCDWDRLEDLQEELKNLVG